MDIFSIAITSYLMGSIPFGFLLTKIFLNKDIRKIGSGNIGATNALRTGNKIIGYATLIFDVLKAVIPVIYTKIYFPDLLYVASLSAFLGHVFPIWLKFKGGKGVATYVGILFSINIIFGAIFVACWVIVFIISRYSSLSSIIGALAIPTYLIIIGKTNMPEFGLRWFTENPMRGGTKNPWDETRTPGGSSGGAAVAVAMGIGAMAHGNDVGHRLLTFVGTVYRRIPVGIDHQRCTLHLVSRISTSGICLGTIFI